MPPPSDPATSLMSAMVPLAPTSRSGPVHAPAGSSASSAMAAPVAAAAAGAPSQFTPMPEASAHTDFKAAIAAKLAAINNGVPWAQQSSWPAQPSTTAAPPAPQSRLPAAAAAVPPPLPPLPALPLPLTCLAPPPMIDDDEAQHQLAVGVNAKPPQQLNDATFVGHFHSLLQAELHRNRADMCRYDLHSLELGPQRVKVLPLSGRTTNTTADGIELSPFADTPLIVSPMRASAVISQALANRQVVATIPVPGVSEGSPRLDFGSVVRLRLSPWGSQTEEFRAVHSGYGPTGRAGAGSSDSSENSSSLEIEGRVISVNIMRDEVVVRLPLRQITRSCTVCATWAAASNSSSMKPATCISVACGHQFMCSECGFRAETFAWKKEFSPLHCPLCSVTVGQVVDTHSGWLPFPSYLAAHGQSPAAAEAHKRARTHAMEQQQREPVIPVVTARRLETSILSAHEHWVDLIAMGTWEVRFEETLSNLVQMTQAVGAYHAGWIACAGTIGKMWALRHGYSKPLPSQVQLHGDRVMAEVLIDASTSAAAITGGAQLRAQQAQSAMTAIRHLLSQPEQTLVRLLFPSAFVIAADPSSRLLLAVHEVSRALQSSLANAQQKNDSGSRGAGDAGGTTAAKAMTAMLLENGSSHDHGLQQPHHHHHLPLQNGTQDGSTNDDDDENEEEEKEGEMRRILAKLTRESGMQSDAQTAVHANKGGLALETAARIAFPVRTWLTDCLNPVQRAAVQAIVSGVHGRVPYLLMGPAGTGKSSCVLEAVMQLLVRLQLRQSAAASAVSQNPLQQHNDHNGGAATLPTCSGSAILVVAPSNEASDLLLQGLHKTFYRHLELIGLVPASELPGRSTHVAGILRLNGPARRMDSMNPSMLPYTFKDDSSGTFTFPSLRIVAACRLVVCNVSSAGGLKSLGILPGHFSHIIFDEASQALEPEALLPLSLAGPHTRVVLTGDPRQLGPMVRSDLAREHWLGVSLQERLHAGREVTMSRPAASAPTATAAPSAWAGIAASQAQSIAVAGTTVIAAASANAISVANGHSSTGKNASGGSVTGAAAGIKGIQSIEAVVADSLNTLSSSSKPDGNDDGTGTSFKPSGSVHSMGVAAVRSGLIQRMHAIGAGQALPPGVGRSQVLDDVAVLCGESAVVLTDASDGAAASASQVAGSRTLAARAQQQQLQSSVSSMALPSSLSDSTSDADLHAKTSKNQGTRVQTATTANGKAEKKSFAAAAAAATAAPGAKAATSKSTAAAAPANGNGKSGHSAKAVATSGPVAIVAAAAASTLEREERLPEDPLDHAFQSTLVINYRSHQALLDLPSRLYYKSTPLVSAAPQSETQRCLGWSLLRAGVGHLASHSKPSAAISSSGSTGSVAAAAMTGPLPHPLLAVGVRGDDKRASVLTDTKSYINHAEADAIAWLCQSLLSESVSQATAPPASQLVWRPLPGAVDGDGTAIGLNVAHPSASTASGATTTLKAMSLSQKDIAVICPFRQQVLLVRQKLRDLELRDVSVGNAQNLQGAQKPCIIFCSVLSQNHGERILTKKLKTACIFASLPAAANGASSRSYAAAAVSAPAQQSTPATPPAEPASTSSSATAPKPRLTLPVGLFHDPKGMNVSLTRAQSLLIAVGDPWVWQHDAAWRELLQTAVDHDGYIGIAGCQLPAGVAKRMDSALF